MILHLRVRFSELQPTYQQVNQYLKNEAEIYEWRRVKRTDSEAGDTMEAAALARQQVDSRSTSYVRVSPQFNTLFPFSIQLQYEMLVPIGGGKYGPKTYYGQLEHIYTVTFPNGCPGLEIFHPTTLIIACIHRCNFKAEDPQLVRLDIHLYKEEDEKRLDVVDITTIQCLVGRVRDGPKSWAIIDRSGSLARAAYLGEETSGD